MRAIVLLGVGWALSGLGGCDKEQPKTASQEASKTASKTQEHAAKGTGDTTLAPLPKHDGPLETHPLVLDAIDQWKGALAAVAKDDKEALAGYLTAQGRLLAGRDSGWPKAFFQGEVVGPVEVNGGRVVLDLKNKDGGFRLVGYYQKGHVLLDPMASRRYRKKALQEQHPMNKELSLAEATAGIKGVGVLRAKLTTSRGEINCELYEKQTPRTVANFVALARGLRSFKLLSEENWVKRPFYTGLGFYQVLKGRKITSGCPSNNGTSGPGYEFEDEFDLSLRHDGIGVLGMVNNGPNTNGSRFYITAGATPQYDDKNTIFGRCAETGLVKAISQSKTEKFATPVEPVAINGIDFYRKP